MYQFPLYCTSNALKQGYIGEVLVADYFISEGYSVEWPNDIYSPWDLKIHKDGTTQTVQVKTQTRYIVKNSWKFFCKSQQTFNNIRGSDLLIVINRDTQKSMKIKDPEFAGRVVLIPKNHDHKWDGEAYWIPCDQEFFDIFRLTDKQLNILNQFDFDVYRKDL
jgi:hypothetical protein